MPRSLLAGQAPEQQASESPAGVSVSVQLGQTAFQSYWIARKKVQIADWLRVLAESRAVAPQLTRRAAALPPSSKP